jgi:phage baseplate assembly protein gpV
MRAGGPRWEASDMSLCGVSYAVVTQNQDDELKQARIKVKFPWMSDSDQSHWAQLAVPMTGDKYGTYVLPDVGDAVYVVFIAGDINHPVVIGGHWNKTDTPPETNENGKNDYRFIKSRAGHRLQFEDTSNVKVLVTDFKNERIAGCGTFAAGGSSPNKLALPAVTGINGSSSKGVSIAALKGKLNLSCPKGKLTISALHVEITAKEKATVAATGAFSIEGASAKVTTNQAAKLEGATVNVG